MIKKLLFILRSTPYGGSKAQEGLDAVLAASVFDQEISVLFMDEGVWQLHNHQQSLGIKLGNAHEKVERKNIAAQLESFPLYDIKNVYVDRKALKQYLIPKKELILDPELVNDKGMQALIEQNDVIFTY